MHGQGVRRWRCHVNLEPMDAMDQQSGNPTRIHDTDHRYRLLVELSPTPLFVSVNGQIVLANRALVELLRAHDSTAFLGRAPEEFVASEFRATARERVESTLRTGQ